MANKQFGYTLNCLFAFIVAAGLAIIFTMIRGCKGE